MIEKILSKLLGPQMDRPAVADLESDARRMQGVADEAKDVGAWLAWYLASAYADGWNMRVRIERWRAKR